MKLVSQSNLVVLNPAFSPAVVERYPLYGVCHGRGAGKLECYHLVMVVGTRDRGVIVGTSHSYVGTCGNLNVEAKVEIVVMPVVVCVVTELCVTG